MNRIPRFLFPVILAVFAAAEPPPPPANIPVGIAPGASPGTLELTWPGLVEHYYFLQISDNLLEDWSYLPLVETGMGDPLGLGFSTDAELLFYRLVVANHWTQEPMSLDFTGSGFSNWNFVRQGLNPFDPAAMLRRMWVVEEWPVNSPVDTSDKLTRPATLRLVSPGGFGMPGGTLVFGGKGSVNMKGESPR